ncbi:hypothetical protein Plhal304r1_c004g0017751 [Plasmopara halstedii]
MDVIAKHFFTIDGHFLTWQRYETTFCTLTKNDERELTLHSLRVNCLLLSACQLRIHTFDHKLRPFNTTNRTINDGLHTFHYCKRPTELKPAETTSAIAGTDTFAEETPVVEATIKKEGIEEKSVKIETAVEKERVESVAEVLKEEEPVVKESVIEEEPKIEEPKVEEPKVEEPKVEEPKVEEPKVEESKVEEPKVQVSSVVIANEIEEQKDNDSVAPTPIVTCADNSAEETVVTEVTLKSTIENEIIEHVADATEGKEAVQIRTSNEEEAKVNNVPGMTADKGEGELTVTIANAIEDEKPVDEDSAVVNADGDKESSEDEPQIDDLKKEELEIEKFEGKVVKDEKLSTKEGDAEQLKNDERAEKKDLEADETVKHEAHVEDLNSGAMTG